MYQDSKPRYEALDGLRGVAALMVVAFHCFEAYTPIIGTQIVNHGYLAVDFFFVLSGFVVSYAYDDRWDRMTLRDFAARRLIRLHPMVIAGTIIGAALFFFGQSDAFPLVGQCPAWKFLLCLAMGLLMIPCGPRLDIRGWSETNSFNGPNWTLTYEYVGNILYALVFRHLKVWMMAICCICAAFCTLDLTLGWNAFSLLDSPHYNVSGGWRLTSDHIYIGLTRLLYPFLVGILLRRTLFSDGRLNIHANRGFLRLSLLMAVVLGIPQIGSEAGIADGAYQALCILLVFPLVVVLGATVDHMGERETRICRWLGRLSYPLYITHYPFIYMQAAWLDSHSEAPLRVHIALNLGVVFMAVLTAWSLSRLYDEPVRRYLSKYLRGNG